METSAIRVLHVLFPVQSGTECSVQRRVQAESQLPKTQQSKIVGLYNYKTKWFFFAKWQIIRLLNFFLFFLFSVLHASSCVPANWAIAPTSVKMLAHDVENNTFP